MTKIEDKNTPAAESFQSWTQAIESLNGNAGNANHGYIYRNQKSGEVVVFSKEESSKNKGYYRLNLMEIIQKISSLQSQLKTAKFSQTAKETLISMTKQHDKNIDQKYGAFAFMIRILERIRHIFSRFSTTSQFLTRHINQLNVEDSVPVEPIEQKPPVTLPTPHIEQEPVVAQPEPQPSVAPPEPEPVGEEPVPADQDESTGSQREFLEKLEASIQEMNAFKDFASSFELDV